MGIKDIKYTGAFDNYVNVMLDIEKLFSTIELLNSELQQLSDCWEGSLASAFSEITSKISEYSSNTILNLKNTEEYKKYAVNTFENVEKVNMGHYNIM